MRFKLETFLTGNLPLSAGIIAGVLAALVYAFFALKRGGLPGVRSTTTVMMSGMAIVLSTKLLLLVAFYGERWNLGDDDKGVMVVGAFFVVGHSIAEVYRVFSEVSKKRRSSKSAPKAAVAHKV